MEAFYKDTCPYCTLDDSPAGGIDFNIFQRAAQKIYIKKGVITDSELVAEGNELTRATYNTLNSAVKEGFASVDYDPDPVFLNNISNDVWVFSGCKTYLQLKEVTNLLKDSNGKIKTYGAFKKDVLSVHNDYNVNYLKAEYNHALACSEMGAKWRMIEADGDRYDLQYRTANDERVRASHALLHNVTLPPSDPFWSKYYPPNGWGCRCNAVQVRKGKYEKSDSSTAQALGAQITDGKNAIFRFNAGKEQVIFPKNHPYFNVKSQINKQLTSEYIKEQRHEVREWGKKNLVGKTFKSKIGAITITGHTLKEIINQPHRHYTLKNALLYNISSVIKESKLVLSRPPIDNPMVKMFHALEYQAAKDVKVYLIVREGMDGEMVLYSIVDSIK